MRLSAVLAWFSLSGALVGCDQVERISGELFPREGARCKAGTAACAGDAAELLCVDGRYIKRRCGGAKGCTAVGERVTCAWGAEQEGDVCSAEEEGQAMCSETSMVSCKKSRLRTLSCLGPKHCRPGPQNQVLCDRSIANEEEICDSAGSACSVDKKAFLDCKDGKFQKSLDCRGPKQCEIDGEQVRCDGSLALPGDICQTDGGGACAVDKQSLLVCKGGKMTETLKCRGANKCAELGTGLSCDGSIALEGDVCEVEQSAACSEDAKSVLSCVAGKMKVARRCNCKVSGDDIVCL